MEEPFSIRWDDVRDEAAELLSELIKINTTNPPGNETEAADFLKNFFESEGIYPEVIESEEGRGSIIARLDATDRIDRKPLIFLSHLDVVPANPSEWTRHPFSGDISGGYVWGRGAIDCKGLAVCQALTLALLKRLKIPLKKSVFFISTADEEMGGEKGVGYILSSREMEGEAVLNEGGFGVKLGGRKIFLPTFGEKGPMWLKVKAKGKSGHASVPHKDNPNLLLINVLKKILSTYQQYKITPYLAKSLSIHIPEEVGGRVGRIIKALFEASSKIPSNDKVLGFLVGVLANEKVKAMLRNTISLTVMKGGYKENVIPGEAEAVLDVRLLPGEDPYNFVENLKRNARVDQFEIEIAQMYHASQSPPDSPFIMRLKDVVKKNLNVPFVPILATGFTDSRYFRDIGIQSYGFMPCVFTEDELGTIHGVNERISLENIKMGIKILFELAIDMCASGRYE
jgi:acetylornithine deacetylase/succinyl-diaminopimelate desuccinylase-like protein